MVRPTNLLMVILLVLINSCSSMTSNRYREGNNKGQKSALTVTEEKKLSLNALSEMKKDYPPLKDQELQKYISQLGQKIVHKNHLKGRPYQYHFTVVDSPMINAFALPAGYIFITTPIIAMADSEAEIAGVLGHEIGHVTARHTAERMYIAKKEQTKTKIFGAVGAAIMGTAGYYASKKLCSPKDLECKAKLIGGGAVIGAAGGLFIQKYGFMKNSQEDELESDRVGFRYATKAGYDKNKVGDFYHKLLVLEKKSQKNQNSFTKWLNDAFASHPSSQKRVAQAEEMKRNISQKHALSSSKEFFKMKKKAQRIVSQRKKKPGN